LDDDKDVGYDPLAIERRWRDRWEVDRLWDIDVESVENDEKFFNLVEFPYPSAEGLHVGHVYTYCGADTFGRYMRMHGRKVFQPIGFDSFGIHTENYALRVDKHPKELTARTIRRYREDQLQKIGVAWDWEHQVTTSDPEYYRWTQWIFVQLFKAGLALHEESSVYWCPSCLTVIANEQLEGDRCERCGSEVETRMMRQWFLKMTAYAQRLLDGLENLDWPDMAKRVQAEWIGRSEGVEIDFPIVGSDATITAFTTRPDTTFGVTFVVLAFDHPLLDEITTPEHQPAVRAYAEAARRQAIGSRSTERSGVPTGAYCLNPATGEAVPVWVSDYVLSGHGTGAVMGVPAHDQRDYELAVELGLPIREVVTSPEAVAGSAWEGPGTLVDSGEFDGLPSREGAAAIADWLEAKAAGKRVVHFRLHDWLISRQRYWGPPIPIVHCPSCGPVAVPESELPVLLPDLEDFRPDGTARPPLARSDEFVKTTCPECGEPASRETDVSDTFLDSAWYFLRYPSSDVDTEPWDPNRTQRMLPVDQYAGGREHIARHHLYARFITMALHDMGHVDFEEPFPRLRLHGLLVKDGAKMSKSRGNVVNPDDYMSRHGVDVLRMYLLFCGKWEVGGDFRDEGITGIERFLSRVWRLAVVEAPPAGPGVDDLRFVDRAVAGVGDDLRDLKFNTAIAQLMVLVNELSSVRAPMTAEQWSDCVAVLTRLLAPLAPFIAEELWERQGRDYSVHFETWPAHDPAALAHDLVTIVVQVNGKVRDRVEVAAGASEDEVRELALGRDAVAAAVGAGAPRRVIYVADRLLNLVV